MGSPDALSAVRRAVRDFLARHEYLVAGGELFVAVSGGADSLALTDAAARAAHRAGLRLTALVVDHRLQDGSAEVAATAAATARKLGADEARVLTVTVSGPGGLEAAARTARYSALRRALPEEGGLVLLGHTRDDQAETVLLGLGRGSGPRSVAGMRPLDPPWGRPLLALPRSATARACAELGVEPWTDPHNADPRYTRVRLRREVLPLLEDVLNGGVAAALARTAAQLREDSDALDGLAAELLERARDGATLDVGVLAQAQAALRRRALRTWLLDAGVRELTDAHLRSVDALVGEWRGQGGVWLPGNFEARRSRGKLCVEA
ncbi:tRNA lysidine(34) synthetase TilS [Prauserella sp. PE36]|uniref:tRNA(Ile)-lysidine synthase n=1 Tax=Prauserella endophytica TaxID=1592324 RepID=A0ABY2S3B5_9PSEU|nr:MULTISPECIES: tRNA lysidine(34) synthetase TilS [Prauserella]PXY34271.1 tRNA lysidine(34) synthetase TilS [Prauserella coralliicola]RBM23034.1 tRNA lysidine(34) synthetase TilS [Prauserella sp. PE36]TKG70039.1 tRNA lysidine(34) synthetase TilS [Prauserella endophytica]